jgi:hypothetical protein
LVAAHHQQRRAVGRALGIGQQAVDTQQTLVGAVMGFAA